MTPRSPDDTRLAADLLDLNLRMMRSISTEMRRMYPQLAPGQMGVLFRLTIGPATMSDLARYLGVSLPTVSKSIGVLVRRGWIERWIDAANRRQTIVRLTALGRRAALNIRRRSERHLASITASLDVAERRQLLATLELLNRVLPAPACGVRTVTPRK